MITDFVSAEKYIQIFEDTIFEECEEIGIENIFILYNFANPNYGHSRTVHLQILGEEEHIIFSWVGIFFKSEEDRNLYRLAGTRKELDGLVCFELAGRYMGGQYTSWDIVMRKNRDLRQYIEVVKEYKQKHNEY